jgi:hypothetical protein
MLAVSSTNMWKVVIHRYSCLLKEKHSIYIKLAYAKKIKKIGVTLSK